MSVPPAAAALLAAFARIAHNALKARAKVCASAPPLADVKRFANLILLHGMYRQPLPLLGAAGSALLNFDDAEGSRVAAWGILGFLVAADASCGSIVVEQVSSIFDVESGMPSSEELPALRYGALPPSSRSSGAHYGLRDLPHAPGSRLDRFRFPRDAMTLGALSAAVSKELRGKATFEQRALLAIGTLRGAFESATLSGFLPEGDAIALLEAIEFPLKRPALASTRLCNSSSKPPRTLIETLVSCGAMSALRHRGEAAACEAAGTSTAILQTIDGRTLVLPPFISDTWAVAMRSVFLATVVKAFAEEETVALATLVSTLPCAAAFDTLVVVLAFIVGDPDTQRASLAGGASAAGALVAAAPTASVAVSEKNLGASSPPKGKRARSAAEATDSVPVDDDPLFDDSDASDGEQVPVSLSHGVFDDDAFLDSALVHALRAVLPRAFPPAVDFDEAIAWVVRAGSPVLMLDAPHAAVTGVFSALDPARSLRAKARAFSTAPLLSPSTTAVPESISRALDDARRGVGAFSARPSALSIASSTRYIGLRNLGATCYMNSLLQQLFMMPLLRHAVLSSPPLAARVEDRESGGAGACGGGAVTGGASAAAAPSTVAAEKLMARRLNLRAALQSVFSGLMYSSQPFIDTEPFVASCSSEMPPTHSRTFTCA